MRIQTTNNAVGSAYGYDYGLTGESKELETLQPAESFQLRRDFFAAGVDIFYPLVLSTLKGNYLPQVHTSCVRNAPYVTKRLRHLQ